MAKITRYTEKIVNGVEYPTIIDAVNAGAISNMRRQFKATRDANLIMGLEFDDKKLAQAMYQVARQAIVDVINRERDKGISFSDIQLDKTTI